VRTIECPCGRHLEARNDEELAQEILTHAREEHNERDLTEDRAREMVASHASGTEDDS
jgi:predicted small metal-binding protein